MSSMFENYDNLNSQYIPTNIPRAPIPPQCPPGPLCPPEPNKPYEDRNAKGELIGYWWSYGDTINLDFNLSGYVTIDGSDNYIPVQDFIKDKQINISLYNFRHEQITNMLFEGQNYQDTTYIKAPYVNHKTIGIYYTYSLIDGQEVYTEVTLPKDYIKGTTYYETTLDIVFPIDKELSKSLVPGTYYCSLTIIGKDVSATIFYEDSCTLTVR